jgi:hypothetical protein
MSEKKSLWSELQKRDPVLVKIFENVYRVFGKPEKRTVKLMEPA